MKSHLFILFLVLSALSDSIAQRTIRPSDILTISGKVKTTKQFSLADLAAMPNVAIPDQVIYNQEGVAKDTLIHLRGVALKSILAAAELVYDKPKQLNTYYYVMTATDGYTVVFSWNEIFNTVAGDQFYIITEMKGKPLVEMEQRIAFISTADVKAGRRYIKALETIDIRAVE